MEYNIYQKESFRTCSDLGGLPKNLSHMMLGLMSEMEELEEAIEKGDKVNIGEEIADMFWYISGWATLRSINFNFMVSVASSSINNGQFIKADVTIAALYNEISKLSNLVKRYLAYGKEIEEVADEAHLFTIAVHLYSLAFFFDIHIPEQLDKNIKKLRIRFPDKFSKESALNRSLSEERSVLEG